MCEVVVDDQHISTRFHERFRNAGRGVRSDIGKTRRVVAFRDDDHGVIHRAIFPQGRHGLRNGGRALADGTINAQDILAALVEDGVNRNGGLTRLAVAEDQLALSSPNGNERIDDFEARLERHRDGRAVHDGRGGAFDGQALAGCHWPIAIEWPAERVDYTPSNPSPMGMSMTRPERGLHSARATPRFAKNDALPSASILNAMLSTSPGNVHSRSKPTLGESTDTSAMPVATLVIEADLPWSQLGANVSWISPIFSKRAVENVS